MKYNHYSSVCNICGSRGYHDKPEKCVRELSKPCKCCGSREFAKLEKCKGTNQIIDYSKIALQFAPYYESKERVKVAFVSSQTGRVYDTKSGIVGITTGWKPVFILLLRKDSVGSSLILSDNDNIII